MEKSEACGSLGMWWNSIKRMKAPISGRGHMQIRAMNHVTLVKIDVMGSVNFVKLVMTGSPRVRNEKRPNVGRRQMGRRMWIGATG